MTLLTAEQLAIVTAPEAAIVVLAGPGSGKTLTLIQRIAYRIQHDHVPPTQILALAFNRAAAHELRQRLTRFIGDQAQQVRVSTFHGCALAITGKTPDAARWDQVDFYDDLLGDAIVTVSDPDTVPVWCAQLREIVCDEYQDADSLIAMFVAALANAGQPRQRTIIVAGDDDQAIYEFRGGSPEHLRAFAETFHATRYVLTANFRCTASIIAAANALITQVDDRSKQDEHEQGRVDPARQGQDTPPVTIITYDGGPFGERPRLATAISMAWVADRISQWLTQDGIAPQEIAVLARAWDHLARVQQELRYRQIPITRMRVRERRDRMSGLMQTLPAQHWIQDLRCTRNQRFTSTVASLLDTMCATWAHRATEPSVSRSATSQLKSTRDAS